MDKSNADGVAREIVARLEQAGKAGDGRAFAEPFAEDADFVDIRGQHHHGREAIASGHQAIFDSIYQGSRITYELVQARALTKDVCLAHVSGELSVPSGLLAGSGKAIPSLVLVRAGSGWEIASFHNTPVALQRG